MRDIKFRAWDKKENVMRTLVTVGCSRRDVWNPLYIDCGFINGFEHSDYEVMQYTGLHDKNGKEIYEEDIVKVSPYCDDEFSVKVEYADGAFVINCSKWSEFDSTVVGWYVNEFGANTIEVIGNIYENPEQIGDDNA